MSLTPSTQHYNMTFTYSFTTEVRQITCSSVLLTIKKGRTTQEETAFIQALRTQTDTYTTHTPHMQKCSIPAMSQSYPFLHLQFYYVENLNFENFAIQRTGSFSFNTQNSLRTPNGHLISNVNSKYPQPTAQTYTIFFLIYFFSFSRKWRKFKDLKDVKSFTNQEIFSLCHISLHVKINSL